MALKENTKKLLEGKIDKVKVLIMSIENNFVDILDFFEKRFKNAKKIYKIIMYDLFLDFYEEWLFFKLFRIVNFLLGRNFY